MNRLLTCLLTIIICFYYIESYNKPFHIYNKVINSKIINNKINNEIVKKIDSNIDTKIDSDIESKIDNELVNEKPIDRTVWNELREQFIEKEKNMLLDNQIDNKINSKIARKLINKLDNKLDSKIDSEIDNKIANKLNIRKDAKPLDLYNKLRTTLANPIHKLDSQVDSQLDDQIDRKIDSQLDSIIDGKIDTKEDIEMKRQLAEYILLALTRIKNPSNYLFTSFQVYYQWLKANTNIDSKVVSKAISKVDSKTNSKANNLPFLLNYITICYVNNYTTPANKARDVLLIDRIIDKNELFIGQLCYHLYTNSSNLPIYLSAFYESISNNTLTINDINMIIKVLGKTNRYNEIFKLFDRLLDNKIDSHIESKVVSKIDSKVDSNLLTKSFKKSDHIPNEESYEYLANALVKNVDEELTIKAMKDLPKPNSYIPEILLAGRSNVGKSSLVNFLVNRKALASTSATPGHTKQFHFYSVNKNRNDLPNFFLVDVPGLGYAEASNSSMDSWKNVIDRYITVRESLSLVLHLVDSRHGITSTDQQLIDMITRALTNRKGSDSPLFNYAIILTKSDRLTSTNIPTNQINDIKNKTMQLSSLLDKPIDIITTSIVDKIGRYELWKLLQPVLLDR